MQYSESDALKYLPAATLDWDYDSPFQKDFKQGIKTRNWVFCIYPEWPNIGEVLLRITSAPCYWFISPLHTDLKQDGTPCKPHFHVLVMFDNERVLHAVLSLFGLAPDYRIYACTNCLGNIRYMIHYGYNKQQYPRELLRHNNEAYVTRAFSADFGKDNFYGLQLLRQALDTIQFETEWDLECYCYEHHLERVFHACRSSIHNSWYQIQRRSASKWVDSRSAPPPKDCPFGEVVEIEYHNFSWEDLNNG